ncbi:ABC transporter permease [Mycetocola reblochoni]|uniref:Dipeptide transport system permease protein DppB (TC 3.A.1.5.2) n=2 Tax=Mycetocola reblochoni TaxID=331618 RepID=A0A1R4JT36_9MICO|nr:ABC transporter permease [Mycetocola reblochoni]RLP70412.1 ABC transporter permease [Mycetocola reblochoni]SJN35168.1 Dipeptide transport system permease protein DppB (TC 3.A.1.5.2) [Mycetocola reblochoni REB411]
MTRILAARAGALLAGLALASLLIFLVLRVAPGDAAQVIAGTDSSPERVAAIRAQLGLDRPLPVQYLDWIGGLLRGDLGVSSVTGTPVAEEIAQKLQVTAPLTAMALLVALVIAMPLGVVAALRRTHPSGRLLSVLAQLAAAVPVVWAGMLLVLVFAVGAGWFPVQGFPRTGWDDPAGALRALVLPAIAIGVVEGAVLLRIVRSAMIDAAESEHVLASAARGGTLLGARLRRGLAGAGVSVVSVLGVQTAGLLVGAVIVEQLFSLPGLGRMLVADVGNRDLVKVQSEVLLLTAAVLVIGVLVDLAHRLIDPRLRVRS